MKQSFIYELQGTRSFITFDELSQLVVALLLVIAADRDYLFLMAINLNKINLNLIAIKHH